jgi:hypothetical protein
MPSTLTYAKGNEIIVSSNPKGHMEEVIISGTPKPGTCMELMATEADANGHFTYRAVTGVDGAARPVAVLTNQLGSLVGKTKDDARVSGDLETIYFPSAGEQLNMLVRDQPSTGTAGVSNVGDRLGIDGASGMLQAIGSGAYAPFDLLIHLGIDQTANFHAWCRYRGDQPAAAQ